MKKNNSNLNREFEKQGNRNDKGKRGDDRREIVEISDEEMKAQIETGFKNFVSYQNAP